MALPSRVRAYLVRQRKAGKPYKIGKKHTRKPVKRNKYRECRSCGNVKAQKQEHSTYQSPFLSLPAELRNRIYEYALSENLPYIMARDLNRMPPAWLRTSKQIYNEALKPWFYINQRHTVVEIEDLDARPFLHWTKRRRELKVPFNDPPVHCRQSFNWANLMVWCKAAWAEKDYWEISPSNAGTWARETNVVVWSALEIARDYHDLPWEDCERALCSLRNAITVYEPRWGGFIV